MNARVVNLRDFRDPANRRRFILPPDVVRIDRPSRWGNPYRVGGEGEIGDPIRIFVSPPGWTFAWGRMAREDAIAAYRRWLENEADSGDIDFLEPLRGKRLACWCAPLPCHGDVIAELIS